MPSHYSAMPRRFAKQLVVKQQGRAAQKLPGSDAVGRRPPQVVKTGRNPPAAQGMKERLSLVFRLVALEMVEKLVTRITGVRQPFQLFQEHVTLRDREDANTFDVTVTLEMVDLVLS